MKWVTVLTFFALSLSHDLNFYSQLGNFMIQVAQLIEPQVTILENLVSSPISQPHLNLGLQMHLNLSAISTQLAKITAARTADKQLVNAAIEPLAQKETAIATYLNGLSQRLVNIISTGVGCTLNSTYIATVRTQLQPGQSFMNVVRVSCTPIAPVVSKQVNDDDDDDVVNTTVKAVNSTVQNSLRSNGQKSIVVATMVLFLLVLQ